MRSYWPIAAVIAIVLVVAAVWRHDASHPSREADAPASGAPAAASPIRLLDAAPATMQDAPQLPEPERRVILNDGPRRPGEPGHTYNLRHRLAEKWNKCRNEVVMTDEQARAVLLSLYDLQQQVTKIEAVRDPHMPKSDEREAVQQVHAEHRRRLKGILSSEQHYTWETALACAGLPMLAFDGTLRIRGDKPGNVYRRIESRRSRLMEEMRRERE